MDEAAAADDPCHVGQQSVCVMRGAGHVVEQNLALEIAFRLELAGVVPLVVHRGERREIFSGMGFTGVDEYRAHGPVRETGGEVFHARRRHRAEGSGK